jgi:antitoxin VapB
MKTAAGPACACVSRHKENSGSERANRDIPIRHAARNRAFPANPPAPVSCKERLLTDWGHGMRRAVTLTLDKPKKCIYFYVYTLTGCTMSTARVFRSGNSQAVRLPKEFRFDSEEVEIFRRGDEVVLREKTRDMQRAFQLLADLPDDFLRNGRNDTPPQKRKAL